MIADIAQLRPIPSSSSEGNEYVSTKDPEAALQDPLVARIFRYYVDNLASWYDLNDSKRHFEDIVSVIPLTPQKAHSNPAKK